MGSVALLALLSALAQPAGGVDALGAPLVAFELGRGDGVLNHRPRAFRPLSTSAGVRMTWMGAGRPTPSGASVLEHAVVGEVSGSLAVARPLRLAVVAPAVLTSVDRGEPRGADFADVRVAGTWIVAERGTLAVALSPHADLPTGDVQRLLGRGSVAGGATASMVARFGVLDFFGNSGLQLEPDVTRAGLVGGDRARGGGGIGVSPTGELDFTAEISASSLVEYAAPADVCLALAAQKRARRGSAVQGGAVLDLSGPDPAVRVFLGGGFGTAGRARVDPELRAERIRAARAEVAVPVEPVVAQPRLTLLVMEGDALADGAVVHIAGPDGEARLEATGTPLQRPVPAYSLWEVSVWKGDCLAGSGHLQVAERDGTLAVGLKQVWPGRLRIRVRDADGAPLAATLRLGAADPSCVPAEAVQLPQSGGGLMAVGLGAVAVEVSMPGFDTARVPVEVGFGGETPVDVVLEAAASPVSRR